MKRKIVLTIAILTNLGIIGKGATYQEALGFSAIDYNPSTAGMAGSGICSSSTTAYAFMSNIAMVPYSDNKLDITASYQLWAPSTAANNDISIAGSSKIKNFGIAAGFVYNMYPTIEGNKPSEMIAGAGISYKIKQIISIGVNARYAMQTLKKDVSIGAFMMDIQIAGKWKGISASAGVSNIGNKAKLGNVKYPIPSSLKIGLGYDNSFSDKHYVEIMANADYYFSNTFSASLGAQYGYNDMVFIRAGYRYGGQSVLPSFGSIGLGCKFKGVKLDLAYIYGNDAIKNGISVGVGYCF